MNNRCCAHFFLGANTPDGFYSLYDELNRDDGMLYIIKGGPGCGKSSFMRRLAEKAEEKGYQAEYIHCSGDPDSLDAVIFPRLKLSFADGTAPHVLEPRYPAVTEQYIDLGQFYNSAELQKLRRQVIMLNASYKAKYASAYRTLSAAGQLYRELITGLESPALRDKLLKRSKGIISRELPKKAVSGQGTLSQRFLSAVSCSGLVSHIPDIQAQRVYCLKDSWGLSHTLLEQIVPAALQRGYDVTVCRCPLDPQRIEHVLIPERSLAFVSSCPALPFTGRSYRRVRVDNMLSSPLSPQLKETAAGLDTLLKQTVTRLSEAKQLHDRLEGVYNPHVDFDGVYTLADSLAEKFFN